MILADKISKWQTIGIRCRVVLSPDECAIYFNHKLASLGIVHCYESQLDASGRLQAGLSDGLPHRDIGWNYSLLVSQPGRCVSI
jgi:hypothetical protein